MGEQNRNVSPGIQGTSISQKRILNSWKEIAGYLNRGVRTVQRWERELGLPVRRPRGKTRSAVIAIAAELDDWADRNGIGPAEDGEESQGKLTA